MLDANSLNQLKEVFGNLNSKYILNIEADPMHQSKKELVELLTDVASCSENISVEIKDGNSLSFDILKDGSPSGISFRAVPNGHEFTSLLLAILNLDGKGKNLPDQMIATKVAALNEGVELKTYVSLTCTNCPDVVQAINSMVAINPSIKHVTVDGGINKEEVEALNIQAVPSVYLNGELLHVGRADFATLLEKIENKIGTQQVEFTTQEQEFDVLVVGGGPAGAAAAIYSARKGLRVGIIADNIGGQVKETVDIENLISKKKTTGAQLAADLMGHISEYPISVLSNRKVERLELDGKKKKVIASTGEVFVTPSLIIATGASWRKLAVPGEEEYIGRGLAFCPHCDGPFYKGKDVAVIGGGNSGIEAAIDLAGIASSVTVIEFLDQLKADEVLVKKAESLPNVKFILNSKTNEIIGDGSKLTSILVEDRASGELRNIDFNGVFVQIGLVPNAKVFSEVLDINRAGEIEIDSHCRTNVPGIYAAGDVSSVPYKQIVIAMGEGAKAALSAFDDRIRGLLD